MLSEAKYCKLISNDFSKIDEVLPLELIINFTSIVKVCSVRKQIISVHLDAILTSKLRVYSFQGDTK